MGTTGSTPGITYSNAGSSTSFDKTVVGSTYRNNSYGALFDGKIYQLVEIADAISDTVAQQVMSGFLAL